MLRALTRVCLLLCIVSCLSPALFARARFWGYAEQGGKSVLTNNVPSSLPKVMGSFPGSTVTVRNPDNSLATLYFDLTGTAKANPFTADSTGLWFFYADALSYNVTFSGAGVSTPFTITAIDLSNYCSYDTQYSSLAAAVAGIPDSGCLYITASWTLTSGITLSRNNVTIYCPSGSIHVGTVASNLFLFTITGTNDVIDKSCTFDGGSHSFQAFINVSGATNPTLNGTIQNGNAVGVLASGTTGTVTFNLTCTALGNGSVGADTDQCVVGSNTNFMGNGLRCSSFTSGDCFHATATFSSGGTKPYTVILNNVVISDPVRYPIEIQGNLWSLVELNNPVVQNVSTTTNANLFTLVSVEAGNSNNPVYTGTDNNNLNTNPSFHLNGGRLQSGTAPSPHGLCIEQFGPNAVIDGVTCVNNGLGVAYSGGIQVTHSHFLSVFSGIQNNPTFASTGIDINHNDFSEICSVGVQAKSGAGITSVTDNKLIKTPGSCPSDTSTPTLLGFEITGGSIGRATMLGNLITILPGSIPGSFGFEPYVTQGGSVTFEQNSYWNQNATAFGQCLTGGANFAGAQIFNTTCINSAVYSDVASTVQVEYHGNTAPLGTGSVQAHSFLLETETYANIGSASGFPGSSKYCSDCLVVLGYVMSGSGAGSNITLSNGIWRGTDNSVSPTGCNTNLGTNVSSCSIVAPSRNSAGYIQYVIAGSTASSEVLSTVTFASPFPRPFNGNGDVVCIPWGNNAEVQNFTMFLTGSGGLTANIQVGSTGLAVGTHTLNYMCRVVQ